MLRPVCRAILLSAKPGDLVATLAEAGCEAHLAADLAAALDLKANVRPELILLHGCEATVSGKLRRHPPQLQAVYCALLERERLGALEVAGGYDDFLTLPLLPAEVAARVRLWRWRREQIDSSGTMRAGPLVVDLANLRVSIEGETVSLTFKEYELLCLLLRRRGQVLTRDHILDVIWGPDYYGGNRTVDVHIRRLRTKLPEVADLIVTVHGIGYRLDS